MIWGDKHTQNEQLPLTTHTNQQLPLTSNHQTHKKRTTTSHLKSSNTYKTNNYLVFVLPFVCPLLPVSLNCPFLIAPFGFLWRLSNIFIVSMNNTIHVVVFKNVQYLTIYDLDITPISKRLIVLYRLFVICFSDICKMRMNSLRNILLTVGWAHDVVASFSELSILDCSIRFSLTFIEHIYSLHEQYNTCSCL
jgi:hypothetical protein